MDSLQEPDFIELPITGKGMDCVKYRGALWKSVVILDVLFFNFKKGKLLFKKVQWNFKSIATGRI